MQQFHIPARSCRLRIWKMREARIPVCFCCLETWKNATVSHSRLFSLFRNMKRYNSLAFPLVFALWSEVSSSWIHLDSIAVRFLLVSRSLSTRPCMGHAFLTCRYLILKGKRNKACTITSTFFSGFVSPWRHHQEENEQRKGSFFSYIYFPLGSFRPPAPPALLLVVRWEAL